MKAPTPSLPRVQGSHELDWVRACKAGTQSGGRFRIRRPTHRNLPAGEHRQACRNAHSLGRREARDHQPVGCQQVHPHAVQKRLVAVNDGSEHQGAYRHDFQYTPFETGRPARSHGPGCTRSGSGRKVVGVRDTRRDAAQVGLGQDSPGERSPRFAVLLRLRWQGLRGTSPGLAEADGNHAHRRRPLAPDHDLDRPRVRP